MRVGPSIGATTRQLRPLEAVFLYLPLEHSEDGALQGRCVSLFAGLVERVPPELCAQFESFLAYAERHRAVIERFGRFPHRNELLGRQSTAEELAYLESGGEDLLVSAGRARFRFEVAAAYVMGVGLPLLETLRRKTNFSTIAGYVDDYIAGGLLLYAAWRVTSGHPRGPVLLVAAWAILCGGLYGSFFGQIESGRRHRRLGAREHHGRRRQGNPLRDRDRGARAVGASCHRRGGIEAVRLTRWGWRSHRSISIRYDARRVKKAAPDVAAVFASYPPKMRKHLRALRKLILDTAKATEGVGRIEETLKWGEPRVPDVREQVG